MTNSCPVDPETSSNVLLILSTTSSRLLLVSLIVSSPFIKMINNLRFVVCGLFLLCLVVYGVLKIRQNIKEHREIELGQRMNKSTQQV